MAVPEGCVVLSFSGFEPWDNPDNLISQRAERIITTIIVVGFLNVLFLINVPTNILNMVVFAKQGLRERINLCLFFQSLADLVYMVINFLLYADRVYYEITGKPIRSFLAQFILKNYLLGFVGFNGASNFMTAVIACERCFCVMCPLRAKQLVKTRSMLVTILIAFFVIVGGFFVIASRWTIACVFDPRTNSSYDQLLPSPFYLLHKKLIDDLDVYVYGILLPLICTVLVSVCTVVILLRLKQMASWRGKASSSNLISERDVALTRMLIGFSVLFIVCALPLIVVRLWILFAPDFSLSGRYHNTFKAIFNIVGVFGYVNSSFNFFVYYNLGTKYREVLSSLCGRRMTDASAFPDVMSTRTSWS